MKHKYLFFALGMFSYTLPAQNIAVTDSSLKQNLDEIIITANKKEENILQSPVSIEKLTLREINASPQNSFFDAIQNLKGLNVITPSVGFKVINGRGFANTTNVRFVQMVDGFDNQAPHIGAAIANTLGPNDLDIYRVEIVPGSASAIYGMNAINGIANFITKDPFKFSGISVQQKTGLGDNTSKVYLSETNLRIAQVINEKFAIKLNVTFMKGKDWTANNLTDLNPAANISTGLTGTSNPSSDFVNNYGDESGNRKTLTLGGKQYVIGRTGYAEKDLVDYGIQNLKSDISFYYRPKENIEFVYTYRFALQNNIYQRTNRFSFNNYLTQQHTLSIKSGSFQLKTFLTQENTGNSFNIRSMAENIDRTFKNDTQWFSDFSKQYNNSISNSLSISDAMQQARIFADQGRPQPNTDAFNQQINSLGSINNWDIGAALQVKANLFHVDFNHDITNKIFNSLKEKTNISLMYGLDFRDYNIIPDGNYFINPTEAGKDLNYWKAGGFIQAIKTLWKEKVKLNAVLRIDKNQYFEPQYNPRLSMVYSPKPEHNFRMSVQNGYRFPSIFEAFSNINSGGRKRIGGLPIMSNGIFENSYTQSSISAFQSAVTNDVNKNGMTTANAIAKEQNLLQKNTYTYLQPEQVSSIEMGYRTALWDKKLNLDIDFYYNMYKNLMAQIDANISKTKNSDSVAFNLNNNNLQDKYRLWTNSKTISYNYGMSLGITYQLPLNYIIGGNFTFAKLDRKSQSDGLEDGFNTPQWTYNLSISNNNIYKTWGFAINFKQQAAYLWESALATGNVPSYYNIDAQISGNILKDELHLKIGATNLTNNYYYSFIGGPSIGGFYYSTVTVCLK